ncbi:peroxisomal adenine nucleotide carrier 1 [Tanacetum coccineum]
MSPGSSGSEWDFCFEKGSVIESIDGHTDIIYKILNNDWLPWKLSNVLWGVVSTGQVLLLYESLGTKNLQSFIAQCLYFYGYNYFKRCCTRRNMVQNQLEQKQTYFLLLFAGASTTIITQPLDTSSSGCRQVLSGDRKGFGTLTISINELISKVGGLTDSCQNGWNEPFMNNKILSIGKKRLSSTSEIKAIAELETALSSYNSLHNDQPTQKIWAVVKNYRIVVYFTEQKVGVRNWRYDESASDDRRVDEQFKSLLLKFMEA